jgi:hypothetical protein
MDLQSLMSRTWKAPLLLLALGLVFALLLLAMPRDYEPAPDGVVLSLFSAGIGRQTVPMAAVRIPGGETTVALPSASACEVGSPIRLVTVKMLWGRRYRAANAPCG